MTRFFDFLQRQRLFVHYMTVVIAVLGFMSLLKMQREARPNVNFNRVAVSAAYPGASPADIEELVIDPIEDKISEVDGVEEYRSVSFSGAGSITIKVDDEHPNPEEVADEIRRKVGEVRNLPLEVDDPLVNEIKAINIPILRLAIYGSLPPLELKLEIEKLRDYLKTISGVQSVDIAGLEDLQLKVLTHPEKLDLYDLTLMEVISKMQDWAKQRPGGLFQGTDKTTNLTVGFDYNDTRRLEKFVLQSNDSGRRVQLAKVASIEFGLEEKHSRSLYIDENAVLLTLVKKPLSDIVKTVEAVKVGLDKYKSSLPSELKYTLYNDQARRVRNRMKTVTQNAIFGLILVLLLLILFLDWRSAIVTSIGIPVAVLGGIIVIYMLGNTMNSLVLIGMVIVLGMLVDDAIVVCENIYSYIEKGLSPLEAALKGVREISIPVMATVLTTMCAFFPILFMKEIIGQFLRIIPLTVIAMLFVSLFEALVILPIHAGELMRAKKKTKSSLFQPLEKQYRSYLNWSIKNRWIILGLVLVIFVGSALQGRELFKRFTLFPATGLEGVSVRMELEKNAPVAKTASAISELSKRLQKDVEGNYDSFYSTAGSATTGGSSGSRQTATHLGQINIAFTSNPDFIKIEKQVLASLKKTLKTYSSTTGVKTSLTIDRPGPPIGKPIQLQVASRDFEYGGQIVAKIRSFLEKIDGVHSLETDLDGDSIQHRFIIDNNLAVSEGVRPEDISTTIFAASTGKLTNEILKNNEKVEILVGVDRKSKNGFDLDQVRRLRVRNNNGQAVPISSFIKIVEEKGPSSIQRLNGLRTITLFGEVEESLITGKEANAKLRPLVHQLKKENPTVKIETSGADRDRMRAVKDTMRLYILALLLVFMIISLSFQSVLYPFMVFLTIPMGLCGVVWALVLHGQTFTLMGIIGIVGLSGVVVNISIILLKFMQERLNAGEDLHPAVVNAGVRRLRPIVITTITTLIGLAPTIYGIGGIDTFVQPLALVLGWGLLVATILSLLTLPALISFVPWLNTKVSMKSS